MKVRSILRSFSRSRRPRKLTPNYEFNEQIQEKAQIRNNHYLKLIAALQTISKYSSLIHPSLKELIVSLDIKPDPEQLNQLENNPQQAATILSKSDAIYVLNRNSLLDTNNPSTTHTELPSKFLISKPSFNLPDGLIISLLTYPETQSNVLLVGAERTNDAHASYVYGI